MITLPVRAQNGTLAGSGTKNDPYQIWDYEDLRAFASLVNGGDRGICAELTAEIDASASANPGSLWTPIGSNYSFTGSFNGNYHVISGLYYNNDQADYAGLFGYVDGGTVENVGLKGGSVSGKRYVGGVVGYVVSGGSVTNCYSAGSVSGSQWVGGVAGINGTIQNCYYDKTVAGDIGAINGSDDTGSSVYGLTGTQMSGDAALGGR